MDEARWEEEVIGLEGITGDEQMAAGNVFEAFRTFEDGWAGAVTFAWAVADEDAGDVTGDEVLVEFFEQVRETAVGPALTVGECFDEGIDDDEFGVDAFNGFIEAWEILGKGEGTIAGGASGSCGVVDKR